jgi:hypothetical protein
MKALVIATTLAAVLMVSVMGCEHAPAFSGKTMGDAPYSVLQTWTVKEHNYARNELTFVAHNTKSAPGTVCLTVRITARCEDTGCPFYTGQVLLVTNALDTTADRSWDEDEGAGRMWFVQGEGPARLAYYFEIVKEVSEQ